MTKIEHIRLAEQKLNDALLEAIEGTADLGTPLEIQDIVSLIRVATQNIGSFLRHYDHQQQLRMHATKRPHGGNHG